MVWLGRDDVVAGWAGMVAVCRGYVRPEITTEPQVAPQSVPGLPQTQERPHSFHFLAENISCNTQLIIFGQDVSCDYESAFNCIYMQMFSFVGQLVSIFSHSQSPPML